MRKAQEMYSIWAHLDLTLGAGLTAHGANHLSAVHQDLVVVDIEDSLMPGAHIDVVVLPGFHILQVHDVVSGGQMKTSLLCLPAAFSEKH